MLTLTGEGDGPWRLTTSDLDNLRKSVGESLFDSFCCCFVQADRINSLVNFYSLSQQHLPKDSIASLRNFVSFHAFLMGTMKELGLELGRLRAEMVKRSVWDQDSWNPNLKRFETWSATRQSSFVRNSVAFHVDRENIVDGISRLPAEERNVLLEGDRYRIMDSWFRLGTFALLRAIESIGDLESVLLSPAKMLDVYSPLQSELVRVIVKLEIPTKLTSRST